MTLEQHDILAGLNPPQRQAVTTTQGPVLILAGPGSGKTRVITYRIAYLVKYERVLPWQILAVTFTNKAAREMRERLEKLVGTSGSKEMTVGTFHAVCARILRMEARYLTPLGLNSSFVILDDADQTALIKRALKALHLDEAQHKPSVIQAMISRAKNNLILASDMADQAVTPLGQAAARVYPLYQQLLRSNNSVDFDDLLILTEQLWKGDPGLLHHYQQRWRYLHIDEFQDCNRPQYQLMRLLAYGTDERHEGLGNICVVGDDDQMIYSWRGASAENIVRFERDFPQRRVVLLEQNYRSTQVILDAAQGMVQHNRLRKPKKLWTTRAHGDLIVYYEALDEEDEGLFVVSEVRRLLSLHEITGPGDVAVMYRTNAQSRALEEQFLHANLSYRVIGSRKFYERKEIKDVLAYLRVLLNQKDELSLLRIINVPNRKIGTKTVESVQTWAAENGLSLYEAVLSIEQHPRLPTAAKNAVVAFGNLIGELLRERDSLPLPDLLDRVTERSGYGPELRRRSTEGLDPWSNVLELRRVAVDYAAIETRAALSLFLENVALVGGADTTQTGENGTLVQDSKRDAVTLITLHAAKGLEYPVVFIVGLDEGSLPHARAADKPEHLEEERRLAYVGFTRAMCRLYLVRASRRSLFGQYQDTEPSRFLDDVPSGLMIPFSGESTVSVEEGHTTPDERENWQTPPVDLVAQTGSTCGRGKRNVEVPPRSRVTREDQHIQPGGAETGPLDLKDMSPDALSQARKPLKAGIKVHHSKFGEGVVLKCEIVDGTEFVEVHFSAGVGKRRLSMDFERLERV